MKQNYYKLLQTNDKNYVKCNLKTDGN